MPIVVVIFILSLLGIYLSGEFVVKNIIRFAEILGISVFIISFFLMGVASALPNLFVGIEAAKNKIPEVSLGDVFGNNFINLTLVIALAVFFSQHKKIELNRLFIRQSIVFMSLTALAPLFLVADSVISHYDGLFLILLFCFYVWWAKSNSLKSIAIKELYSPSIQVQKYSKKITIIFYSLKILLGLIILFLSAQGIIFATQYFSKMFNLPLILIGILIVGFGDALPEIYFAISSARKNETQMIFGNMVGSVIAPATLVLGIVSLIQPIHIQNILFLEINRLAYIIVILLILWFVERKKEEINLKNALFLLLIYILFLIWLGINIF